MNTEDEIYYEVEQEVPSCIELDLAKIAVEHLLKEKMFGSADINSAQSLEWALSKLLAFKITVEQSSDSTYILKFHADGMMFVLDVEVISEEI